MTPEQEAIAYVHITTAIPLQAVFRRSLNHLDWGRDEWQRFSDAVALQGRDWLHALDEPEQPTLSD